MNQITEIMNRMRQQAAEPDFRAKADRNHADDADYTSYRTAIERREWLDEHGVKPEHWPGFESPRLTEALWHVGQWLTVPAELPKSAILVLSGDGDLGKSFALAFSAYMRGGSVIQAGQLWEENFSPDAWDAMRRPGLLGIDDLGTERQDLSGIFEERFFALIDARLVKKTVITTNLAGPEFIGRYCSGNLYRLKRRFETYGRFVPLGTKAPNGAGGST